MHYDDFNSISNVNLLKTFFLIDIVLDLDFPSVDTVVVTSLWDLSFSCVHNVNPIMPKSTLCLVCIFSSSF